MDDKVARTHERTVGHLADDYVLNIIDVSPSSYQGTWQFLSVALVRARAEDLLVTHEVIDDLESFVHVLAWICIRCAASKMTAAARTSSLKIFDFGPQDWRFKEGRFREGARAITSLKLGRDQLSSLLEELWIAFGHRYDDVREVDGNSSQAMIMRAKREKEKKDKELEPLQTHQWIVDTMKNATLDAEWVDIKNDGCVDHPLQGSQRSLTANQLVIINNRELKRKKDMPSYQEEYRNEKRCRSSTE
jgi:hypothetical protein